MHRSVSLIFSTSRCCSKVVADGSEWCDAECQARGEPQDDDESKCIICMAAKPDTELPCCENTCVCAECFELCQTRDRCPACNAV